MAERTPFSLTQQSPLGKRTILALRYSENSYYHITYIHIYISSHRKIKHTSTLHIIHTIALQYKQQPQQKEKAAATTKKTTTTTA